MSNKLNLYIKYPRKNKTSSKQLQDGIEQALGIEFIGKKLFKDYALLIYKMHFPM